MAFVFLLIMSSSIIIRLTMCGQCPIPSSNNTRVIPFNEKLFLYKELRLYLQSHEAKNKYYAHYFSV